jgi:putative RNA 2'-phosphotransferase
MAPHPYTKPRLIRLSRALSHTLRQVSRQPGNRIDDQGWIGIDDLLEALREEKAWRNIKRSDLEEMVAKSGKLRFEIRDGHIRSVVGTNAGGKAGKVAARPPSILYHWADQAAAGRIKVQGLVSEAQQYIHLSTTTEDALEEGQPLGERMIMLKIDAARASDSGIRFYTEGNRTWLAEEVPPEFISWD